MRIVLVALAAVMSRAVPAHARAHAACGAATYVVEDGAIFPDDAALTANGVLVGQRTLALGSVCGPVHVARTHTKHGDKLVAHWSSCAGLAGKVRFKGTLTADCATLRGRAVARKSKLDRGFTATIPPTGSLHGQVRLRAAIDVAASARAGIVAMKDTFGAEGATVADDGSTIAGPLRGVGGWLVRIGDARTRTAADGTFTIVVPADPPTSGTLSHPSDDATPVAAFGLVPFLVRDGNAPVPIDLAQHSAGACGMNPDPASDPPACHGAAAGAASRFTAAAPHAASVVAYTVGALGTYPAAGETGCRDQDGLAGADGTTIIGTLANYVASTCDLKIADGCCGGELGLSFEGLARGVVGIFSKTHGPVSCVDNHKGRFCQSVLQGDVGVGVPAGSATFFGVYVRGTTIRQPVAPLETVPVTVHNNGCFGDTHVTKTANAVGGVLGGGSFDGAILHHFDRNGPRLTYAADRALSYTAPSCPPSAPPPAAPDTYQFETDGQVVTVDFALVCATTTSTTSSTTTVPGAPTTTTTAPACGSADQHCFFDSDCCDPYECRVKVFGDFTSATFCGVKRPCPGSLTSDTVTITNAPYPGNTVASWDFSSFDVPHCAVGRSFRYQVIDVSTGSDLATNPFPPMSSTNIHSELGAGFTRIHLAVINDTAGSPGGETKQVYFVYGWN